MSSAAAGPAEPSPRTVVPMVETVLAFVNTRADGGGRQELFGDGQAFAAWLAERDEFGGEFGGETVATDADAAAARELRDALVTLLLAHSGDEGSLGESLRHAEQHLRRAGTLYPLATVVTAGGVELASPQAGVPRVFGTVLAAVTTFAQTGDWGRIKACRNPPCHFGFFDRTRNGSGLYCSTGCGSQVSMRNYRRRQRRGSDAPPEA
ncbi:CGNR zinc finger domain-containing protein [Kitasatospora sp. CM 4170]|uniref:CGNR zinc finger domain-containing protein n=1 Tax=Kitasatospora aburaviensis TaxID=67265 RepID=A0ABW1FA07_9ACTN|nr:CGNR zinc finger domain-containing protein [Kitasatospora sp. CM 4170]WNM43597.1 CGNR zinc finger domain-containing protein [Kitasatospora sp. CM 4170]